MYLIWPMRMWSAYVLLCSVLHDLYFIYLIFGLQSMCIMFYYSVLYRCLTLDLSGTILSCTYSSNLCYFGSQLHILKHSVQNAYYKQGTV